MRLIGVIQARMGSRRFPGKVLARLAGDTVLGHVIRRARMALSAWERGAARLEDVVIAAPEEPDQEKLDREAAWHDCRVIRVAGDPHNVLRRLRAAAEWEDAEAIVRICGDSPLLDPVAVRLLCFYSQRLPLPEYVGFRYPDGRNVVTTANGRYAEVISRAALQKQDNDMPPWHPYREHAGSLWRFDWPRKCYVTVPEGPDAAVDVPADLRRVEAALRPCADWHVH